jgi:hypothetical protein
MPVLVTSKAHQRRQTVDLELSPAVGSYEGFSGDLSTFKAHIKFLPNNGQSFYWTYNSSERKAFEKDLEAVGLVSEVSAI